MNLIPSERQCGPHFLLCYAIIYVNFEDFPWCGLLIDMGNLSVRGDYSRYSGRTCVMIIHDSSGCDPILIILLDIDLGDTLTVDRRRHPWTAFQNKTLQ